TPNSGETILSLTGSTSVGFRTLSQLFSSTTFPRLIIFLVLGGDGIGLFIILVLGLFISGDTLLGDTCSSFPSLGKELLLTTPLPGSLRSCPPRGAEHPTSCFA